VERGQFILYVSFGAFFFASMSLIMFAFAPGPLGLVILGALAVLVLLAFVFASRRS
jgi:hypothetical protein